MKDRIKEAGAQANQGDADGLQARLMERLAPLLAQLDQTLTKRLVRAIGAIVSFRHSGSGLLLSELGAYDFLLSLLPFKPSATSYSATGAIVQESGAGTPRHRFIASALLSAGSGSRFPPNHHFLLPHEDPG